ncbi:conserved hypothetical protein (plasmid) [Borreliella burgdorferi 29805]|uniref:Uncharacterized protein n=1 Tax=Borreliella burgdorferi 118a TaxID=476210 RepID=A0A7U3YBL7_BORBG|nr:conserved hypothetical protein [Borreliella burgdorferi 156a]ACN93110.1 conserved hypothetical protein [Borreliella burgdorferi 118a]ACO38449.1 conserved hypothetical protein [Borreliella burgdorferi 29805]
MFFYLKKQFIKAAASLIPFIVRNSAIHTFSVCKVSYIFI